MRPDLFSPTREIAARFQQQRSAVDDFLNQEVEPSSTGDTVPEENTKRTRRDVIVDFCAPGFVIGDEPQGQ